MRRIGTQFVVAIVDDDPRLLESLEDLLESAGHTVRPFSSGRSLLSGSNLQEIDFLITDIGMPDLDGFELQRLVNQRRPGLPIILISGRHEISDLPEANRNRFFRKPFDGQALLDAVRDASTERKSSS